MKKLSARILLLVAIVSAAAWLRPAGVFGGGGTPVPPEAKLDTRLRMIRRMKPAQVPEAWKSRVRLKPAAAADPAVPALVQFRGDPAALAQAGAEVRSVLGDVASVNLPLGSIDAVAALPEVVRMESARTVEPFLDVSVPATGVAAARSSTGTPPSYVGPTGKNVIIGIVDSGIDITHADFRNSTGGTRIRFLWDQTASGTPPSFANYGREITAAQIDAGNATGTDIIGHGTHVAGIAAGSGEATGNALAAYRYVGMAPEADLIVVKSLTLNGQNLPAGAATNSDIVDGIGYIRQKALQLNRPCVINLSLGGHAHGHDGGSLMDRAVDNASAAGLIIVASNGNEQTRDLHDSGVVASAGTTTISFTIATDVTVTALMVWYYAGDRMDAQVAGPSAATSSVISPGETVTNETIGADGAIAAESILAASNPDSSSGDNVIEIVIAPASPTSASTWSVTLTGTRILGTNASGIPGRFDAWVIAPGTAAFTSPDPTMTLASPAAADEAIAVGAWNTRSTWTSGTGPQATCHPFVLNDIAFFSSRGPNRPSTNRPTPPAKPDITAPGQVVMSAMAASTTGFPLDCDEDGTIDVTVAQRTDADGVHHVAEGTSMSAPHVTGAVALLLQSVRTLTADDVKTLFAGNSTADGFTGAVPNATWGEGKLAFTTLFTALTATGRNTAPASPTGLVATPAAAVCGLTWDANSELDLDGYNVYRATASGGPYTQINTSLVKTTGYTDPAAPIATAFYWVVRAVDTAGQESGNSNEVNNLPPSAPTGLTAVGANISIRLSWTANPETNIRGYNVYISRNSGGAYTLVNGAPIAGTSYVVPGLNNGVRYFFVITAVNLGGYEGAQSAEASGIPFARGAHGGRCFLTAGTFAVQGAAGLVLLLLALAWRRRNG